MLSESELEEVTDTESSDGEDPLPPPQKKKRGRPSKRKNPPGKPSRGKSLTPRLSSQLQQGDRSTTVETRSTVDGGGSLPATGAGTSVTVTDPNHDAASGGDGSALGQIN